MLKLMTSENKLIIIRDMSERTVDSLPEGHDNNRYPTYFAALTASTDSDLYWCSSEIFEDEKYREENDQLSSLHVENREILARETQHIRQSSAYNQPRDDLTLNIAPSSPILHAREPTMYQRRAPPNNPAETSTRQSRRRRVAREPQRHLSPIDEESASTVFPYTIQGSGQTIIRPLPPIPAGAEQQQGLPARSHWTQGQGNLVSTGKLIQQAHFAETRGTRVSYVTHAGIEKAMMQDDLQQ